MAEYKLIQPKLFSLTNAALTQTTTLTLNVRKEDLNYHRHVDDMKWRFQVKQRNKHWVLPTNFQKKYVIKVRHSIGPMSMLEANKLSMKLSIVNYW